MKLRRSLACALLPALLGGCVIIIEPGGNEPIPIPFPLVCSPASELPSVHVIFSARIERSTYDLAERYRGFMLDTATAMVGLGLDVRRAVLVRASESDEASPDVLAAWGCDLENPNDLSPGDVVRYYAYNTEPNRAPTQCITDSLVRIATDLPNVRTEYPGSLSGTSGQTVFSEAPDVVVVVHMDPSGRNFELKDGSCFSADILSSPLEDGTGFLEYAGENVPFENIVHWFVPTEELVDRDSFVDRCQALDGFPVAFLDSLEESEAAYFGPLQQKLQGRNATTAYLSMCGMLVDTVSRSFLLGAMESLGRIVGLEANSEKILEAIEAGVPSTDQIPDNVGMGRLGPVEGD